MAQKQKKLLVLNPALHLRRMSRQLSVAGRKCKCQSVSSVRRTPHEPENHPVKSLTSLRVTSSAIQVTGKPSKPQGSETLFAAQVPEKLSAMQAPRASATFQNVKVEVLEEEASERCPSQYPPVPQQSEHNHSSFQSVPRIHDQPSKNLQSKTDRMLSQDFRIRAVA